MLKKIENGTAPLRDVSRIPDVPIPYLTGQLSCRKIVHDHSKYREYHMVRIDIAKLALGDSLANGFHRPHVQGTMVRHNHPVQRSPVSHHFALDESWVSGIAHDKVKRQVHQGAHAVRGLHGQHDRRFHLPGNLGDHGFQYEAMELFLVPKIIIGQSLVDACDARDFVHSRARQAALRKYFSSGHHDAPHGSELTPFPENPSSNGGKFPVPNEICLRYGFSFGVSHFPTKKM